MHGFIVANPDNAATITRDSRLESAHSRRQTGAPGMDRRRPFTHWAGSAVAVQVPAWRVVNTPKGAQNHGLCPIASVIGGRLAARRVLAWPTV